MLYLYKFFLFIKKKENSLIGLSNKKVKFAKMKFIARVNGIPQGH